MLTLEMLPLSCVPLLNFLLRHIFGCPLVEQVANLDSCWSFFVSAAVCITTEGEASLYVSVWQKKAAWLKLGLR